ncbi:MAG: RNA polymerase subunit sigma-70 [Candidatus Electrothrix sp. LOE1_4_5]|nr:RNA polymerase subunit sigma-70 [Candidatus Electrothrix gigas]MCI5177856.1 RNA polymerase subunit sigma-70 [Candidatus Electrothrix gigas]MCI5195723.1 RNA polymerase subunit sigma-70 [Candidatus Electrothrix gigas]MCI5225711.1 RNA polymerase subunit sigma-70 [Candidatus Electrothrix gigas]
MKALKTAIAIVFTMTLLASYSFAQGQGRGLRCQQRFAELDTNKDGNVTLSEFMAVDHPRGEDQAKAMFKAKDTDNDGKLTQAEFCPRA